MARFVILTRWDGTEMAVNADHVALVEPRIELDEDRGSQTYLTFAVPDGEDDHVREAFKGHWRQIVERLDRGGEACPGCGQAVSPGDDREGWHAACLREERAAESRARGIGS